jgi:hypothetical protein
VKKLVGKHHKEPANSLMIESQNSEIAVELCSDYVEEQCLTSCHWKEVWDDLEV